MFLCLYILNLTLLICHEIESAYWQEWKLFKLPGGITGFVLLHIPLLLLLLWGIVQINEHSKIGIILSLILALAGIFAFAIHTYFIKIGKEGFNLKISITLLYMILIVSIIQLIYSLKLTF